MPTVEEQEAHLAYMRAWLKKCNEDAIAEIEAQLKTERNPYTREDLERRLADYKESLANVK